jgi:hypothetical protein
MGAQTVVDQIPNRLALAEVRRGSHDRPCEIQDRKERGIWCLLTGGVGADVACDC